MSLSFRSSGVVGVRCALLFFLLFLFHDFLFDLVFHFHGGFLLGAFPVQPLMDVVDILRASAAVIIGIADSPFSTRRRKASTTSLVSWVPDTSRKIGRAHV